MECAIALELMANTGMMDPATILYRHPTALVILACATAHQLVKSSDINLGRKRQNPYYEL